MQHATMHAASWVFTNRSDCVRPARRANWHSPLDIEQHALNVDWSIGGSGLHRPLLFGAVDLALVSDAGI